MYGDKLARMPVTFSLEVGDRRPSMNLSAKLISASSINLLELPPVRIGWPHSGPTFRHPRNSFFVPQLQQDLTSARQHIQELECLLKSQSATERVETGVDANEAGAADVAVRKLKAGLSGGETQILTNAEHALKESWTHRALPESGAPDVAPDVAPAVEQGALIKMGTPQQPARAAQKVVDAFPLASGDDEAAFVQGAVVEMGTQQPVWAAKETVDAFPLVSGDEEAAYVQGAVVKTAVSPNGPDKCANDSPAVEESTLHLMYQQFSSLREELTKQLHQNQELQKRVDSLEYQVCACGHTCVLTDETRHAVSNECTQALGPADC